MNRSFEQSNLEPPRQAASPLPGWINTFYRHQNGKKLGPYYVRRWKVGTRLYKQYIKPEDLERTRAACAAHRESRNQQRETNKKINTLISNWNYLGRMNQRFDHGKELRPEDHAHIKWLHEEGMYVTVRPHLKTIKPKEPHPFPFDKLTKSQIIKRVLASLKFRSGKAFMVPKFSKKELDKMERELARSFPANPPENDNQKWSRWKNKLANQPKPKAPHINIQTPSWISGDEIDAMFSGLEVPKSESKD